LRDQQEIDRYWAALAEGGDERAQQCGWLRDRFGVSWQVVPVQMAELMTGDPARAERVMAQVMKMKKLDLDALQQAAAG
jgi:predicted 3-demethylubiquinone-9 3-methyltransferase (glyoxalase superfamily)